MGKAAPRISKQIFFIVLLFSVNALAHSLDTKTVDPKKNNKSFTVITWTGVDDYLSRSGAPSDIELQYLKQFAIEKKLTFKKIEITKFSNLIPALLAGKGDVIAANLTITNARKKQINFTHPFFQTHEYLLMGKNSKTLNKSSDLNHRKLFIQKGKSYQITARGLKKAYPKLKIIYFSNDLSFDEIYNKLASAEFDLTLQDNNLITAALDYRTDLKKSIQASRWRNIAWGVAPKNKKLLNELNTFLKAQQLDKKPLAATKKKGESQWKLIKRTKTIRFVLRNNLSSYYIWRGQLRGFHYELAKYFAKKYHLRCEIIVAPDNVALLNYVINGKADIALGFFTPTRERRDRGLMFSIPYHYASELVVANASHRAISSINALHDSVFYLRRSSSYWQTALDLKKSVSTIHLHAIDEKIDTEEIIKDVGLGKYAFTIADSHILDLEMINHTDIQSLIALGKPKGQSWAIKKGNKRLLTNVNYFIKKHYKGLYFNVLYNKYFKNTHRLKTQYQGYTHQNKTGVLSPYDNTVKKYAKKYHFDWRILVAQMHQESRFNPNAKSMAGARGLFQIMPKTAKELGINDMHDPRQGIKAGIAYMDWVRRRMHINEVKKNELIWFTLAAYNAGAGHVRDAMILAQKKNWDPDIWFNNVEKAMLLLSNPKYAAHARYGYVDGHEPVHYVREIKLRYETYLHINKAINHIQRDNGIH